MRNRNRVRNALFALPVMASLVAIATATASLSSVDPAPDHGAAVAAISNCTYYNNAQHTQVVGQFGRDCCNNNVAWGKKTQFSVCGGCFPCIPPPP